MNKKQLYESIMSSVAKEVKKALNEEWTEEDEEEAYARAEDEHDEYLKNQIKELKDKIAKLNSDIKFKDMRISIKELAEKNKKSTSTI